jgi:NAD(P)-dependent dehydrogenase (short-subunit alcohol dehydrogenase family)
VGQANYGAAKAGIISLTTIAAMEMARYGGDGQRDLADRPDPDARRHRRAAVEAEELLTGLPEVYGTAPSGRLPAPVLHGA